MCVVPAMDFIDTESIVSKKSQDFVRSIETLEKDINGVVFDFLLNPRKNCLLVSTLMTGEANIFVYQALRKWKKESKKKNKMLKKYLGLENQTFLDFAQVIQIVKETKILPVFNSLFVCEVPSTINLENYQDILSAMAVRLRKDGTKKIIIVAPRCDILDKFSLMASDID